MKKKREDSAEKEGGRGRRWSWSWWGDGRGDDGGGGRSDGGWPCMGSARDGGRRRDRGLGGDRMLHFQVGILSSISCGERFS